VVNPKNIPIMIIAKMSTEKRFGKNPGDGEGEDSI
jgi:hypothetical protein